jgi:hypothetical protein
MEEPGPKLASVAQFDQLDDSSTLIRCVATIKLVLDQTCVCLQPELSISGSSSLGDGVGDVRDVSQVPFSAGSRFVGSSIADRI